MWQHLRYISTPSLTRRRWSALALLVALLLASCGSSSPSTAGQHALDAVITVRPDPIPISEPDLVNPMRGLYRWYGAESIPQPRPAVDRYARYGWRQLEPARGQYDFSVIEQALEEARLAGAKFAFRVMAVNEFTSPVEVPGYLVSDAGGAYCTYEGKQVWVPAWDSPAFSARARALVNALGARFNGDPRLGYYDLGLYGHWGEWHTETLCTPAASDATKRSFVDMQLAAFSKSRVLMNSGAGEIDAFVYALGKSPRIGVRVDSLCNPWFDAQFTEAPAKLALMQERWKTAPIVTELYHANPTDIALCDQQVRTWHIAAIGNGRLEWARYTAGQQSALLEMGKHAGYRFVLNMLSYPAEAPNNSVFTIQSEWSNIGVTPAYEHVLVTLELRSKTTGALVRQGVLRIDLQQLLPTTEPVAFTDQLYLPGRIPPGQYTLSLAILDPAGYRSPLALAIRGGDVDGRYPLGEITVVPGPPGHDVYLPLMRP